MGRAREIRMQLPDRRGRQRIDYASRHLEVRQGATVEARGAVVGRGAIRVVDRKAIAIRHGILEVRERREVRFYRQVSGQR